MLSLFYNHPSFPSAFRLTTKNIHLILTLYFALEEINMNPHILPNISLLVKIECRLLDDWRINSLSSKREKYLPNYYCINQRRYLIVLTGPMWLASVIVGPLLYITKRPEVSLKKLMLMRHWFFSFCKNNIYLPDLIVFFKAYD